MERQGGNPPLPDQSLHRPAMKTLAPVDFKAVVAKGCFVYCYLRKSDWTPYYVGIASVARRPTDPHSVKVPTERERIRVMRSGLTWEEACEWEVFYIAKYGLKRDGTGILRNLNLGGEGNKGFVHSEETKRQFSEDRKGKKRTTAQKEAMSAVAQVAHNTPSAKAAHARASAARPRSEEERAKTAASLRLRHLEKLAALGHTEESWAELKKQEKAAKRKQRNEERKAALSPEEVAAKKAEHGRKISLAQRKRYENPAERQAQSLRMKAVRAAA